MSRNFKRTNWTTEEVMELIRGQKLQDLEGCEPVSVKEHNDACENLAQFFYDFIRPVEEMGAMAYCTDDKTVYHIGAVPPR